MSRECSMMDKILPLSRWNLCKGICNYKSYSNWEQDFHTNMYYELHKLQSDMFTKEWWDITVPRLSKWKAIRPERIDLIEEEGFSQLRNLSQKYKRIIANKKHPNIESCKWNDVVGLFNVAHRIKPGKSPVFASKLCHFIIPAAFPIFDNASLGLVSNPTRDDYQEYWECCRQRWFECGFKQDLKNILREHLEGRTKNYPWAANITGMCAMRKNSA